MSEERTKSILGYVEHMPPLPPTVARIIQVANDPHSCVTDMDKVISIDPVLSAKVLKLVNSAYYALRDKITSTQRAIAHLGLNIIKNLALTAAVMKNLSDAARGGPLSLDDFWRHSVGCSLAARILAQRSGVGHHAVEDCGLAGLMHDIGKLVLFKFNADEYRKVIEFANEKNVSMIAAERRLLPVDHRMAIQNEGASGAPTVQMQAQAIDHCYIGYQLALRWNFPDVLLTPITFHHFPGDANPETAKSAHIVHVADAYCKMHGLGFAGDRYVPVIQQPTWDALGLGPDDLNRIDKEWQKGMEGAQDFLDMRV